VKGRDCLGELYVNWSTILKHALHKNDVGGLEWLAVYQHKD
jgi:hypothetical protein